jgi:hypothetical protein
VRVPASEAEVEAARDGGAVFVHDNDLCVCESVNTRNSPWSHSDAQAGANAHLLVMGPERSFVLGADMVRVAVLRPDI